MLLEYKVKIPAVHQEKPALILLIHSVRSNEDDMFRLADQFEGNVVVVSARAPFSISPGHYAWFAMDVNNGVKEN